MAEAIAVAYLDLHTQPTLALQQTPRNDERQAP